jgi:hypothetical protein
MGLKKALGLEKPNNGGKKLKLPQNLKVQLFRKTKTLIQASQPHRAEAADLGLRSTDWVQLLVGLTTLSFHR